MFCCRYCPCCYYVVIIPGYYFLSFLFLLLLCCYHSWPLILAVVKNTFRLLTTSIESQM